MLVASKGAHQRCLVDMTTENVEFVCTVRYTNLYIEGADNQINDCPRLR